MIPVMGAQMGKTGGLLNVIGHQLDDSPAPILYIGPTKNNVSSVIEPQILSMLHSAPSLWAKVDRSRGAQRLSKVVAGVSLRLAWAGSPTELASQPAKFVLVDELDRMKPIAGEGDVFTLAEARNTNYLRGRGIATSTPTEGNVEVETHPETGIDHWKVGDPKDLQSPIWRMWQEGTRFEWAVPCPDCGEYFIPRLRLLWWPKDASPRVAKREARLMCPKCGSQIDDSHKQAMNAAGAYLAPGQKVVDGKVVGEPPDSDTASFWVSGLMSPWKTFGDRAADFIRAEKSGDQERLRVVINTGFGELYSFKGDAPPAAAVRACIAPYKTGELMSAMKALTCGVDVQKKRLIYAVRGWGYGMQSWLVDYGEIWGESENPVVWDELAELLERKWGPEGKSLVIRRMGIDSGYRPGDKWRRPDNVIYDFCLHRRAVPTKGRDRLAKPLQPSLIDVNIRGQVHKKGLQLWHIDSDYFKSWIVSEIQRAEGQPTRFYVPRDITDDYCMQLTSEARVPKASGLATWVKIRSENHYLDCEAINVAMAQSLGFHRRRKPSAAAAEATDQAPEPPRPAIAARKPATTPTQPKGFPQRRNWTTQW